jgi:phage gp36-like protein
LATYATRADIETTYGGQYLETLVAADLDMDIAVARACQSASAEIDLYIGQRYTLPIAAVPAVVTGWAVDLACWKLAPNAAQNSKETASRADRVLAMLKDIAAGRAKIHELEPPPSGGASGGVPTGEIGEGSQDGAAFYSDARRYGSGGRL